MEGWSSESRAAAADILWRMISSMPLLLQVPSVMCAYSAATAGVVLEAASSSTSPCKQPLCSFTSAAVNSALEHVEVGHQSTVYLSGSSHLQRRCFKCRDMWQRCRVTPFACPSRLK